MTIKKMNLPYSPDVLAPYISEETFRYHYGKHYLTYINKLNTLIIGTEYEKISLENIIKKSSGNIFNNAAQVWNHQFYWLSMSKSNLDTEKEIFFNSSNLTEEGLKKDFIEHASSLFGSGWCWLVKNKSNQIKFINSYNADSPIKNQELSPLFVCDVWEHAYYVDYRNDRMKYLNAFWNLINWGFVNKNLGVKN